MSYYIGTVAEMPIDFKQEAEAFILSHKDVVILGTKQDDDIHLTLMGLLAKPSLNMLYMQSSIESAKVQNIKAHDSVEIAISGDTGGIILTCKAEVIDDEDLKKEKWEDWMVRYHPEGYTDSRYVLLRFIPQDIKMILIEC